MTKAEYRRNGTIIRTRYYDTPEQTQDALVNVFGISTISAAAWPDRFYSRCLLGCAARKAPFFRT